MAVLWDDHKQINFWRAKQLIAFKIAKQLIALVGSRYYNNLTDFIVALSSTCNIIKELKYVTDIVILTLKVDHMHNQICQQLVACVENAGNFICNSCSHYNILNECI